MFANFRAGKGRVLSFITSEVTIFESPFFTAVRFPFGKKRATLKQIDSAPR
jgi:hypothetical protein